MKRITEVCGATIYLKFKKIMYRYEDNPEALLQAGIAYATDQIIDLVSRDVDCIYLYTMNNQHVAKNISKNVWQIISSIN